VALLTAVVLLAAALTAAIIVTVHYRDEAAAARRQLGSVRAAVPPSPGPLTLSRSTAALHSAGPLAGEVTAFAVRSSAGLAQIIVTARITGGRPHSRYELIGGDCAGNAADHYWAAGVTDARGVADLAGPIWRVSVSHEYFLQLSAGGSLRHYYPGPIVHGFFGIDGSGLYGVRAGINPC
jgi:hypothetical protein